MELLHPQPIEMNIQCPDMYLCVSVVLKAVLDLIMLALVWSVSELLNLFPLFHKVLMLASQCNVIGRFFSFSRVSVIRQWNDLT